MCLFLSWGSFTLKLRFIYKHIEKSFTFSFSTSRFWTSFCITAEYRYRFQYNRNESKNMGRELKSTIYIKKKIALFFHTFWDYHLKQFILTTTTHGSYINNRNKLQTMRERKKSAIVLQTTSNFQCPHHKKSDKFTNLWCYY